jgi:UDP-N-acetylglucosamine diphosphorylase / glucose-1-phosphate thymidylyltransferase / UDP-N-acetylgalactosamine diphosphorylase / glucosamine-1-phosphate N-acetyltransferase / galactosamine-1-phosphate N-acetyltransferase
MLTAPSLFDLSEFAHARIFSQEGPVWQALNTLKPYMDSYQYPQLDPALVPNGKPLSETVVLYRGMALSGGDLQIVYGDTTKGGLNVSRDGKILAGATVLMAGAILVGDRIVLGNGVLVEPGAMIKSPAIIDDCCEIRQTAYLRGYCLAGKRCILGHATEIKNSIFLNDAKAGHFAYLGDSILGNEVNLGAGTKFANLRFLQGTIIVRHGEERLDTGRRKFGAILGDGSQTGCNSVTSPGTIFGKGCMLMPNATAPSGYHPEQSLLR